MINFRFLLLLLLSSSLLSAQTGDSLLTLDQMRNPVGAGILVPLPEARFDESTGAGTYIIQDAGSRQFRQVEIKSGKSQPFTPQIMARPSVVVVDGLLYLSDIHRGRVQLTQTPGQVQNPQLSPDAKRVAFTRNNDLYAIEIASGKESRLTYDGSNLILNGWASWVYYEEILGRPSHYRSFWWAPDSRSLAFFRADDTEVPMFPIYSSEGQHGFLEQTRYPKAGDPNPKVKVGMVSADGGPVVWADFDENADQYFGLPFWMPDASALLVQWMNRDQTRLCIYSVDPANGRKQLLYQEEQPTWIDWKEDLRFVAQGASFLIQNDTDGWNQIYRFDVKARTLHPLTSGKNWSTKIVDIDEKKGWVYFTSRAEHSTRTDFYRVRLNGKDQQRLTFGPYSHTVVLSPAFDYFITTYSNLTTPPRKALVEVASGKVVAELGDARGPRYANYALPLPQLVSITTPDGFELPGSVIWPLRTGSGVTYPVLISVYGGPDATGVTDVWKGLGMSAWWASEGVIQLSIDHRGAGHHGKAGLNMLHRNLCKWEITDYISWVKWLRTDPRVDSTRVGITGSSYGGTMTAMALSKGAGYFQYGIAEFGVTSWELYDSHYTERYMDRPVDNPDGYKNGSVLTWVHQYRGGDNSMLRLVHGTMDDNVHLQNSLQLAGQLQEEGKEFEFMLYPGGRHGWGGAKSVHNTQSAYRFWYKYLLQRPVPEALLP